MKRVSYDALIASGYMAEKLDRDGNRIYRKGKLSVFYCGEIDRKFYLNHQYPFDFEVTHMYQLEKLEAVINENGLIHLEEPIQFNNKKSA